MLRGGTVIDGIWLDNIAPGYDGKSGQYCPLNGCINFDIEKMELGGQTINRITNVSRNFNFKEITNKKERKTAK